MGEFRQFRDVTLEETCPQCQGSGVVVSPKWEAWEEEYGELFKEMLRRSDEDGLEKLRATMPDEPEEIACPKCGGLGKIPTPQGEALLEFISDHLPDHLSWKVRTEWRGRT